MSAEIPLASALGAALQIRNHWNQRSIPDKLGDFRKFKNKMTE